MFESRPYEEGIKTSLSFPLFNLLIGLNRDLMKKGLRLSGLGNFLTLDLFESRPYEEGIKTRLKRAAKVAMMCLNRDLMKKGLRPELPVAALIKSKV